MKKINLTFVLTLITLLLSSIVIGQGRVTLSNTTFGISPTVLGPVEQPDDEVFATFAIGEVNGADLDPTLGVFYHFDLFKLGLEGSTAPVNGTNPSILDNFEVVNSNFGFGLEDFNITWDAANSRLTLELINAIPQPPFPNKLLLEFKLKLKVT